MPEKRYLVTPGPTPVPPAVLAATAAPMIHHRSPDFRGTLERVTERLQQVFRTENDIVHLTSAGTGAMESAMANLVDPGDPVLVISAGSFGDRWHQLAKAYGADVDLLEYEWGETPSAEDVAARLAARAAKAVFMTQSETSTDTMPRIVSGPNRSIVPGRHTSTCEMLVSAHSVSMWFMWPRTMRTGRRK